MHHREKRHVDWLCCNKRKITPAFTEVIFSLVDLKGIEPSNLTDANRALSQLSYRPILSTAQFIIAHRTRFVKSFSARNGSFFAQPLHQEPPAPAGSGAGGFSYALSTKIWESKSQAAASPGRSSPAALSVVISPSRISSSPPRRAPPSTA